MLKRTWINRTEFINQSLPNRTLTSTSVLNKLLYSLRINWMSYLNVKKLVTMSKLRVSKWELKNLKRKLMLKGWSNWYKDKRRRKIVSKRKIKEILKNLTQNGIRKCYNLIAKRINKKRNWLKNMVKNWPKPEYSWNLNFQLKSRSHQSASIWEKYKNNWKNNASIYFSNQRYSQAHEIQKRV